MVLCLSAGGPEHGPGGAQGEGLGPCGPWREDDFETLTLTLVFAVCGACCPQVDCVLWSLGDPREGKGHLAAVSFHLLKAQTGENQAWMKVGAWGHSEAVVGGRRSEGSPGGTGPSLSWL